MTNAATTTKSDRIKAQIRAEMLVDYKGRPFTGDALKFYSDVLDFMLDGMVITVDAANEQITMKRPGSNEQYIVARSDRYNNQFVTVWYSDRPEIAKNSGYRGWPSDTAREAFMNYFKEQLLEAGANRAEAMAG